MTQIYDTPARGDHFHPCIQGFVAYWCLAPFIDMVNGKSGKPTEIQYNSRSAHLELYAQNLVGDARRGSVNKFMKI